MPITHTIDPAIPRVRTTATGVVTYEELCRHLVEEAGEGALGLGELLDGRGATTDLTAGQARTLAFRTERLVRERPFGPLAMVATTDVAYGMARMYQTLCDHLPVRIGVFRDVGEARRWLDGLTLGQGALDREDCERKPPDLPVGDSPIREGAALARRSGSPPDAG